MSIFKEEVEMVYNLMKTQTYIFLDDEGNAESCDKGHFDSVELRKQVNELIESLPKGIKSTHETPGIFFERRFTTNVCWESDESGCNFTHIIISWFAKTPKNKKAYFEFSMSNHRSSDPMAYKNNPKYSGEHMENKHFSRKIYIGWNNDIVLSIEKINRTPKDLNLSVHEKDENWINIFDVYEKIDGTKIEKYIGNPVKLYQGQRNTLEDILLNKENWVIEEELEQMEDF